ncbi:dihydrodipicolinate synthase family protein [Sporosarcina aquimarina]|uniref:dihydrodipicolinate synthase family protein n=1 Tax=Sporosarcina aquimarina TaxID=114975 RepID=UPI001C8EA5EF|nr:dihydrodipicolinate synthase family protein [Sporosarcina aquimarina]MBY0223173.1 dihydrodipicolinate synthase family protein [Sporosarcina aquimarina]
MKGIIPPVVTLLDKDGRIAIGKNKEMIDNLIGHGVHGIVVLGSSGEFPHFSLEEKKQYLKEIIPYIDNRIPVLVGTGGTVLEETIELSQYAQELGAEGVLAVNPYYWNMSDEQMYTYFHDLAGSLSIDLYLYNIPQLTGQEIPVKIVKQLADNLHNIRGIKETVGSMTRIRNVIEEVARKVDNFHVYSAFDEHLLDAQLLGAAGSINGSSVFLPEVSLRLYEAIQEEDFTEMKKYHVILCELMDIYGLHPSFYLTMKKAVHERWFADQPVGYRKPFINSKAYLSDNIKEIISEYARQSAIVE